jgi:hypothetical protein
MPVHKVIRERLLVFINASYFLIKIEIILRACSNYSDLLMARKYNRLGIYCFRAKMRYTASERWPRIRIYKDAMLENRK